MTQVEPAPPSHLSTRLRAAAEWALIAAGLLIQLFWVWKEIFGDGGYRYENLVLLLEHGTLRPRRWEGAGYSLLGPLFSAPLYYFGKWMGDARFWVARFNVLLFIGFLGFAAWALRNALPGRTARVFLLLLVAGSMFPHHTGGYYAEVFSSLFAALGLFAWAFGRPLLGSAALVLAAVNVPALLVPLGLVCAIRAWGSRRLRWVVPVVVGAALYLLESRLRRGSALETYYLEAQPPQTLMPYSTLPGFSYPLLFGVLSILFSFGKGLLLYTPGAFLPLKRSLHPELPDPWFKAWRWSLWFLAGMVLVYAKWWAWNGDWFWGPRFFLFASIPSAMVLATRIDAKGYSPWGDALTTAALVLSCWVAVNGIVFSTNHMELCAQAGGRFGAYCHYTNEYSALWRPFVIRSPLTAQHQWMLAYFAMVAAYLAVPLLARLARRVRPVVEAELTLHDPRHWRF